MNATPARPTADPALPPATLPPATLPPATLPPATLPRVTSRTLSLPGTFLPLPDDAPAYGGQPERKAAAVRIAVNHQTLLRVNPGRVWHRELGEAHASGNLTGCMTHHVHPGQRRAGPSVMDARQLRMQWLYGIHASLGLTGDTVMAALPPAEAPAFLPAFMDAVPVNADLWSVMDHFRAWMLRDLLNLPENLPQVKDEVLKAAQLFEQLVTGDAPSNSEWNAALKRAYTQWHTDTGTLANHLPLRAVVYATRTHAERQTINAHGNMSTVPVNVASDVQLAKVLWTTSSGSPDSGHAWGVRARDELLRHLRQAPQTGAHPDGLNR